MKDVVKGIQEFTRVIYVGTSQEDAETQYIALVKSLQEAQ